MKLRQIDFKKIFIWMSVPVLFWGSIIFFCVQSCSNSPAIPTQEEELRPASMKVQPFRLPDIPDSLTDPGQRADYLSVHYWDNFDFTDTTGIASPGKTEQILSDYIAILPYVSDQMAQGSIHELMYRAEQGKHLFPFFAELLEKYLYDPNSPFRNEEYYLHVLRYIEASPALDEIQKIRFAYQLSSVLKNRKGTKAADFTYTLSAGDKNRMHNIQSDYLLLYFNNPDCHACEEIQAGLEASPIVSKAIKSDRLKVLAVYPDEDLTEWKTHPSRMPACWLNSYDAGQRIKGKELYDLRAIPSLYLLDKNKTVLVKDGTIEQVEQLLTDNRINNI